MADRVMSGVTFYRDEYGGPAARPRDDSWSAIGSLMTGDVQNVASWALRLLAYVDDVESGRSAGESWQGNSWDVAISKAGVHLQDLESDDWTGTHTLAETRAVLLEYLRFLLPGIEERRGELAAWERDEGREHPSRAAVETG
ncbi:hypothetical protein AB0J82_38790 [Asanoa sp. NPDC049518]|uniref:hypothetical protein n=1 Tax=unclassified Asanoa TaxID=2685164 RepID=UPI00341EF9A2